MLLNNSGSFQRNGCCAAQRLTITYLVVCEGAMPCRTLDKLFLPVNNSVYSEMDSLQCSESIFSIAGLQLTSRQPCWWTRTKRFIRGGGDSHMKGTGMLVIVSLRGVNFGFWSHLGCSGQNATIFSRQGLV